MAKAIDKNERRPHRSYMILALFAATAILGAVLGGYLDNQYGFKPWGTIIAMLLSYGISWGITLKWIVKFKEIKEVGELVIEENKRERKIKKNKKVKKGKKS